MKRYRKILKFGRLKNLTESKTQNQNKLFEYGRTCMQVILVEICRALCGCHGSNKRPHFNMTNIIFARLHFDPNVKKMDTSSLTLFVIYPTCRFCCVLPLFIL